MHLLVRPALWPQTAAHAVCAVLLLVAAVCAYVVHGDKPSAPFWDENYYVSNAERYLRGVAQFQSHPPLGLIAIAAGEALLQRNAGLDTKFLERDKKAEGEQLPKGYSFAGLRLVPSLMGALGALLFYGLVFTIARNPWVALLASLFYVCENAYVVHFRAAHLDGPQMFFVLAALWQFTRLWRRARPEGADGAPLPWSGWLAWRSYAWIGLWAGLAAMVRVNGIVLLILPVLLAWREWRVRLELPPQTGWRAVLAPYVRDLAIKVVVVVGGVALAVFATFWLHASLTRVAPEPGSFVANQDVQHMSPEYREWLRLREHGPDPGVTPQAVLVLIRDHFRFMDQDQKGVPKLNPNNPNENGSEPWRWPLQGKTINYRWDSDGKTTSYVQLAGNTLSWMAGGAALIVAVVLIINTRLLGIALVGRLETYRLIEVYSFLWGLYMVMHMRIASLRVMYLYHYFIALLFSYVLVVLMWQYLSQVHAGWARRAVPIWAGIAALVAGCYFFILPLTNHLPLTRAQCEQRNVLFSVVRCVN